MTSEPSPPGLDRPRIWQYWETPAGHQKPSYITLCQEAVRAVCVSCEITLVTPETLHDWLPDIPFDLDALRLEGRPPPVIALKVDYIRMALLHRHGGMWLDSDTVPVVDLGPVMMEVLSTHEFWAMRKSSTTGKVSNGALASVPGSAIARECLEAMTGRITQALDQGRGLKWNELGLKVLTPAVERHAATCHIEAEENFHPIHHQSADRWWTPSDRERLGDLLPPDAKLCSLFNALATPNQRTRTRRQLMNGNSLISQLFRRTLGCPEPEGPLTRSTVARATETGIEGSPPPTGANATPFRPGPPASEPLRPEDVEIVFTTLKRPDTCLAFVKSIREVLDPKVGVHIAVQGGSHPAYVEAEQVHGCRVSYIDEDAGVSAARDMLVKACERPIVFLCDDDFVFDERLEFERALAVMSSMPQVGVLGGLVDNQYYGKRGRPQGEPIPTAFNNLMWKEGDELTFLPLEYVETPRYFLDETFYLAPAHTVNNFALMRRELFTERGVGWDEGCRCSGQHELFYHDYHALPRSPGLVCYTNLLIAQHHRRMDEALRALRSRTDSLLHAMNRMGVTVMQVLTKGLTVKTDAGVERLRDRWWTSS